MHNEYGYVFSHKEKTASYASCQDRLHIDSSRQQVLAV